MYEMTMGEFRRMTAEVPDDARLAVSIGMGEYSEDLDVEYREYGPDEDKGGAGARKMLTFRG